MELEKLAEVFEQFKGMIRAAFLFGSRAEGNAGPMSDYDFAVLPREGVRKLDLISELLPALVEELSVPEDKVDIVLLSDPLPEELWYRATLLGIPLYVESGDLLTQLRLRGLRFLDFKVHVRKLKLLEISLEVRENEASPLPQPHQE